MGESTGGTYTQDLCSRTVAFDDELTWADPDITISATDWLFEVGDVAVPMRTLEMSAVRSEDGASLTDFAFTAYMDSADFTVAEGDDPPCEFISTFGIDCPPCEGDAGRTECLSVELTAGTASKITLDADLVPVTASDVSGNAECAARAADRAQTPTLGSSTDGSNVPKATSRAALRAATSSDSARSSALKRRMSATAASRWVSGARCVKSSSSAG